MTPRFLFPPLTVAGLIVLAFATLLAFGGIGASLGNVYAGEEAAWMAIWGGLTGFLIALAGIVQSRRETGHAATFGAVARAGLLLLGYATVLALAGAALQAGAKYGEGQSASVAGMFAGLLGLALTVGGIAWERRREG